jgi:preprotein translocase subunit SecY
MVNSAGMIPLIFAGAILQFPAIIASYFRANNSENIRRGAEWVYNLFSGATGIAHWPYWLMYFLFVVGFTFFYATVLFEQQNPGRSLIKQGAKIPGIFEPPHQSEENKGKNTQRYLAKIQSRITLPGALFLGFVAILPFIISVILPQASQSAGLFLFSSAGLIIVVGVVKDTFNLIDAELEMHGYQGSLIK